MTLAFPVEQSQAMFCMPLQQRGFTVNELQPSNYCPLYSNTRWVLIEEKVNTMVKMQQASKSIYLQKMKLNLKVEH